MPPASAMEAATTRAAAEAGLSAGGESSSRASVIKPSEGTGAGAGLGMGRSKSMLRRAAVKFFSMESSAAIESASSGIEVFAVREDSAVRYEPMMVEKDIVVMPIRSPVVPAPAKSTKVADSKTDAPHEAWAIQVQPRVPVPLWPDADRRSINEPGIVLRNINHFWIGRLDHNGFVLIRHLFLRRAV